MGYFGEPVNANASEGTTNDSADITGEGTRNIESDPANSSLVAESADSCSTGLLGMAMNKYPDARTCLAPCHSSCPTLNAIMTAYMTRGGQPAAIKEACAHKSGLTCLFGNVQPCMGLVHKAKGFGMTIPTSAARLDSMCSRRLQYFGERVNANTSEGTKDVSTDTTGDNKRHNETEHA